MSHVAIWSLANDLFLVASRSPTIHSYNANVQEWFNHFRIVCDRFVFYQFAIANDSYAMTNRSRTILSFLITIMDESCLIELVAKDSFDLTIWVDLFIWSSRTWMISDLCGFISDAKSCSWFFFLGSKTLWSIGHFWLLCFKLEDALCHHLCRLTRLTKNSVQFEILCSSIWADIHL